MSDIFTKKSPNRGLGNRVEKINFKYFSISIFYLKKKHFVGMRSACGGNEVQWLKGIVDNTIK
jgi:hypothetical protein